MIRTKQTLGGENLDNRVFLMIIVRKSDTLDKVNPVFNVLKTHASLVFEILDWLKILMNETTNDPHTVTFTNWRRLEI